MLRVFVLATAVAAAADVADVVVVVVVDVVCNVACALLHRCCCIRLTWQMANVYNQINYLDDDHLFVLLLACVLLF